MEKTLLKAGQKVKVFTKIDIVFEGSVLNNLYSSSEKLSITSDNSVYRFSKNQVSKIELL
jgi:hypothetical protein